MQTEAKNTLFCAGLPYIGTRTIDESERKALLKEARREGIKVLLSVLAIPICIVLPVYAMWHSADMGQPGIPLPLVFLILFSMWLFGLPLSILIARDLQARVDVLRKTASAGEIRCFEGEFNKSDWTDRTASLLSERCPLNADSSEPSRIELFMQHDIIYRINGERLAGWIPLELTSAALPPAPIAPFALPREWTTPETSEHLERRRLSQEEIDEIRFYGRKLRRGIIGGIIVFTIMVSFIVLCVTTYIGIPVRERIRLSLAASVVACGLLIYWPLRRANRFLHDADTGWAIVYSPSDQNDEKLGEEGDSVPLEFLPASKVAWRIGGKPAGWRRNP